MTKRSTPQQAGASLDASASTTTQELIELLIDRVRTSASKDSVNALRYAYGRVLDELESEPLLQSLIGRDGDVLGAAYEQMLPAEYRRPRGQFFTPAWAADVLASWLLDAEPKHVLDPALGSGSLLLPMASGDQTKPPTLLGIDTDSLTVRLAQANFTSRQLDAQLVTADFLVDQLPSEWPLPDAVICNPPYARHQALSASRKDAIHKRLTQSTNVKFDRRASMPALFLARALEISSDNARLAFITPSGWLDANYATGVKEHLLGKAFIEAIVLLQDDHLFFDGVLTTSAITLITKGQAPRDHKTALVRLNRKLPSPRGLVTKLRQKKSALAVYIDVDKSWRVHAQAKPGQPVAPLSAFATVHRGVATGKNDFFVLSENARTRHRLSTDYLRACLATPKLFRNDRITNDELLSLPGDAKRWLLALDSPDADKESSPLGDYLRLGRSNSVHTGYLTSNRTPWYGVETRPQSPILFPYFNREEPRFVRNTTDAVPLNNWLIIQPKREVDPDELFKLLLTQETRDAIGRVRRVYARGLWKVEPRDLSTVDLGRAALRFLGAS